MDALTALRNHPLLANVPSEVVDTLRGRIRWHLLPGGRELMGEGDLPLGVYVLDRGRLRASRTLHDGRVITVGEVLPGEVVGELSILMRRRRTATVRALRDSRLIFIPTPVILELFTAAPEVVMAVVRDAVGRAESRGQERRQRLRTIAVLPAGEGADLSAFCVDLSRALKAFGSVRLLNIDDRRRLDIGRDETEMVDWLHQLEDEHDFVIFQGEQEITGWTRRCVRQADRILLVGNSHGEEGRHTVERWLDSDAAPRVMAERSLVLIHDRPPPFQHSEAWLEQRQVAGHFHVRPGGGPDVDRLARLLTGASTAVVLSGGGARGLAHIGVLQGLTEAGLTIDAVVGTSIGAVIGAWFAEGHPVDEMIDLAREFFVRRSPMTEYTLPSVSLVAGNRVETGLRDTFGDRRIEDMLLPFLCTSSNLSTAQRVLHDRGRIWRALRASIAIPGVLPPVPFRGDLLVDGGVLNNLPADLLAERFDGEFIAVDVGQDRPLRVPDEMNRVATGLSGLVQRFSPSAPNAPGMIDLLYRSALLGSTRRTANMHELVDRTIRPLVAHIGTLEFERLDECIALGREAALRALD